jgi:DNA-binding transcriptional ArsR family regulator
MNMDELSIGLLDWLIEKTFEDMTQDERLAFVERLSSEMPLASQERFLRRMLQTMAHKGAGQKGFGPPGFRAWPGPPFMDRAMEAYAPQDIGPWRACCRMMTEVDRASQLQTLDASRPVRVFGALSDETRIKIVKLLSEDEKNVGGLAQRLESPQSTISHHLRVLKETGLVRAERRGRSIYYSIDPSLEKAAAGEHGAEETA